MNCILSVSTTREVAAGRCLARARPIHKERTRARWDASLKHRARRRSGVGHICQHPGLPNRGLLPARQYLYAQVPLGGSPTRVVLWHTSRLYDLHIWKQVGGTTESLEASVTYLSIYLSVVSTLSVVKVVLITNNIMSALVKYPARDAC
jgi:hypothetical protein